MINYPLKLDTIFDKLLSFDIKAIIVGGFVRDYILGQKSKDIDVELYNLKSLDILEDILKEFGHVNSVGKSFGVCKLTYDDLDIDFSLPREDSKISSGHKGFVVKTNPSLDFKTASSRRDFTINAIGFDISKKKILDPFYGIEDLKNGILKAVDLNKFDQDPLRVLRAMGFCGRFELKIDNALFLKSKSMIKNKVLSELPKERIFTEFEKLFLKSKKPSYGLKFLKDIDGFSFFTPFQQLTNKEYFDITYSINIFKSFNIKNKNDILIISFSLFCSKFKQKDIDIFLDKLTNNQKLITNIKLFNSIDFDLKNQNNYNIYKLATKVDIELFTYYLRAKYLLKKDTDIERLILRSKELHVFKKPLKPIISGKDLIKLGYKPSKEFKDILNKIYDYQLQEMFKTKEEAIKFITSSKCIKF